MFKSVEELKKFIIWAKTERLKRVKVGDIEVDISELNFIDDLAPSVGEPLKATEERDTSKTLIEHDSPELQKEDEELLYWSSSGRG